MKKPEQIRKKASQIYTTKMLVQVYKYFGKIQTRKHHFLQRRQLLEKLETFRGILGLCYSRLF